jgi:hypothetical protein
MHDIWIFLSSARLGLVRSSAVERRDAALTFRFYSVTFLVRKKTGTAQSAPRISHTLRMIASFALLGAPAAGLLLGWHDQHGDTFRLAGAAIGIIGALGAKPAHLL